MNISPFLLPRSDFLTEKNGGNHFSFQRTRRGEITCRRDVELWKALPQYCNPGITSHTLIIMNGKIVENVNTKGMQ